MRQRSNGTMPRPFAVQAMTVGRAKHPAPLRLDVTDAGACTERVGRSAGGRGRRRDDLRRLPRRAPAGTAGGHYARRRRTSAKSCCSKTRRTARRSAPRCAPTLRGRCQNRISDHSARRRRSVRRSRMRSWSGDGSALESRHRLFRAQARRLWIYNIVVNHFGKKTESEIHASGALARTRQRRSSAARSISSTARADSVGSENETVLMLGDDVGEQDRAADPVRGGKRRGHARRDHRRAGRRHALLFREPRHRPSGRHEAIMSRAAIERLIRMARR